MLQIDFNPFPTITTERLLLRELTLDDTQAVFDIRSDPRVMQFIGRPIAQTLEDSTELLERTIKEQQENTSISWGITLKGDPTVIGMIGFYRLKPQHFRGEVGYSLHADHWRKGIMGEALRAVVEVGFGRLGLHSIEADTDPLNVASNALLKANGFVREGLFKENYFWNGKFVDSAVYSRLAPK